jgi:predicted transcriptional regulator
MSNKQASIMMSIRPTWCAAIADGRKHVEVRRTCPNRVVLPVKVLVY